MIRSGFKKVIKYEKPNTEELNKLRSKKKLSKCCICKSLFEKRSMSHVACSDICAIEVARIKRIKKERIEAAADRKATKEKIEARKGLSYWEGRTERACNAFIRKRDENESCISCGVTNSTAWQAGHYVSVGANSTLRFNQENIHKQCVQCNMHKGSNAIAYRIGLVNKIGYEKVEALEAWHPPFKMTIEYCKELELYYKNKLKELK
jgi:Bacteriophage Lambda NinG protein